MWVKLKEGNIWINLDKVFKVDIVGPGEAKLFTEDNRLICITNPKVSYLGKEYTITGLLSQAPWTMVSLGAAQKKLVPQEKPE